ncbi:MAG: MgtC/SapB family protein [Rhizobiaceae bacterium]|nr:MgtC/SapB family protein [Rhizobiaceae bacterium]MCV0407355.1 MgtC/SapB family protein [Rhizobiaceae bacterium]
MEAISDIGHSTYLSFTAIAARLGLATLLGAVLGFEREWRERPAGLRTHILVCLAAAIVALLSIEMTHATYFSGDEIRLDPIRLIEAVTAGVAFLAAGMIIFARGEVHGLTTGAGMWLAGAIGLCCGLGFWQIATFATGLALIVLILLRQLEKGLNLKSEKEEKLDTLDAEQPARGKMRPKP